MKTPAKITLLLFSVFILFIGCSKDKMMERRLFKADGEWNIDHMTWTIVKDSSAGGVYTKSGTTDNAGTFIFDNPGTGSFFYTIDSMDRSGTFNWNVDDEKATIAFVTQTVSLTTGTTTQKVIAYTGTQPSKKKLTIEGTETEQYAGGSPSPVFSQFVITATFQLTKK